MPKIRYDLDQPMGKLLELAGNKFGEVCFETVTIGNMSLDILQIKDMPRYIEKLVGSAKPGKSVELPLWAKIWPSCLFLGFFLQQFPFKPEDELLEVGAGVAVIGLVAAKRGLHVTVSDLEDDALLFARINALKNGVEDKMDIAKADFTKDSLGRRFDHIIGCEVLYNEATYEPLADFLVDHLAERADSEVILAMDRKREGRAFFNRAKGTFGIMRKDFSFTDKDSGEEQFINLFRMRRS
ncbi:class I SAM-dependent methyltransferase [Salidesulfovibrio onnuriiensis]|uniref:class I SAM-dependent methyltransferase n=1 Tax=Salidesulfovibrio onnuriiensis TaxID=2583823 RepID=UPI00202B9F57|nr:protein N-lysine methyltransferase family protein [Salidesulfovibrio onnuriiensis]